MENMKWTCECGTVTDAKYCPACGTPRSTILSKQGGKPSDAQAPERTERVPTLKEVRAKKETHGPLVSCTWTRWSNGMMMGSREVYSIGAERRTDGSAELTVVTERSMVRTTKRYRAEGTLLEQIDAVCKRENLAAWSALREVFDPRTRPTDYSHSAGLALRFDDSALRQSGLRDINWGAASQQGGGAVLQEIVKALESAVKESALLSTEEAKTNVLPFGMGTIPAVPAQPNNPQPAEKPINDGKLHYTADGRWICPACGEKNSGRFCANCGSLKPEAEKA